MKGYHCKKCNHWFQLRIIHLCPVCGYDDVADRKKRKQEEEERVYRAWRNIFVKAGILK
jgi:rRNA maturation endonuclease Nob1